MPLDLDKANKNLARLEKQVGRLADATEKQTNTGRKFLLGITFGVGTALGASVLATIFVLIFSQVFSTFGLTTFDQEEVKELIIEQIDIQTPQ